MLHKISPGFLLKTGAQLVKKASQSFASADAKALLYVFCCDMCVAENTLRGVSVELSGISGQQRRRTQRSFLEKVALPLFRQSRLSLRESSVCQKSLAEFRVRRRESDIIRFLPRHVRGRKHFARSERRIVRYQRTTEAQNAAKLSRKSGKATFSTVSTKGTRMYGCP